MYNVSRKVSAGLTAQNIDPLCIFVMSKSPSTSVHSLTCTNVRLCDAWLKHCEPRTRYDPTNAIPWAPRDIVCFSSFSRCDYNIYNLRCCKPRCLDTSAHIQRSGIYQQTELVQWYLTVYEAQEVLVTCGRANISTLLQ